MHRFGFDPTQLEHASDQGKDLHNEINIDATQRRLVQDLGDLVGPALGIDTIPCRGLWLQAVRQWQREHHRPASAISTFTPEERLRAAFAIKDYFLEFASSMLVDRGQRASVKDAVDRAYALYMSKYNSR